MGRVVMWVGQPVSQPARLSFFGCESESASEAGGSRIVGDSCVRAFVLEVVVVRRKGGRGEG